MKTRSALENDIAVKENSIQIDERVCLNIRKNMSLDPNYGPIFNLSHGNYHGDKKGVCCT